MKRALRVLHIEDNNGDALLVAEYAKELETFDLEIDLVQTIGEAVDVLSKESFDIVLLDLGLPDGEGIEAIHEILYRSAQACLIVITGNTNIKKAKQVMAYGAQDYLLKDHLSTYVLERSITYALERQEIKQKEIKQNEKLILLETAVNQSANSIIITDKSGRIEYVNDKTIATTGYTKEELIGTNPKVLKSGDQSQEFYEDLWSKISNGTEWHGNFKNKRKDGSYFWEKASISPITNQQGDITHYVAIKEDITEQKMMADRLNFTLDAANIGSWEWNIIDDHVEHNEIWFKLLGYGKDEIDSTHHIWQSLIHSEDFEKATQNLEAYLEGKSNHYGLSYRMLHKKGHYVWIYDTGRIIEKDQDGKPTRMLGLHLDITEVKSREIEAQFERALLHQSQSVSKTGSWYYSAKEDVINYISDEFYQIMGLSSDMEPEFALEEFLSRVYLKDKDAVDNSVISMKGGESVFLEHRIQVKGKIKWLQSIGTAQFDKHGRYLGMLGVIRDITKRKKYELSLQEQLHKNKILIKDLNERIKESECLFGLAQLGHLPEHDNELVIKKALELIPKGFLKPDLTQVSITYNGKSYQKKPIRVKNKVESQLVSNSKTLGVLVVGIPAKDESGQTLAFLEQEHHLMNMLSGTLSLIINNNEHIDAMEASEQRFKALIEKASFGVGILKDKVWVDLNQSFLEFLKVEKNEVIGKAPWEISPKRQPDGQFSKEKALNMLKTYYKEGDNKFYWQHQASDGTLIDCNIWLAQHTLNSEDFTLVFVSNITEEMAAQKSLALSEARFRSILEHATVGISIIKDSVFVDVNQTYAQSLGFSKDELRGKLTEKVRPELQSNGQLSSELIEEQLKVLEKTDSVTFKMEYLNSTGSIIIFEVRLTQMEIWGEDTFVGFTVDITESEYINRYMRASLNLYEAAEQGVKELKQVGMDEVVRLTNSKNSAIYNVDEKSKKLTMLECDAGCVARGCVESKMYFPKVISYQGKSNAYWQHFINQKKVAKKINFKHTVAHRKVTLNSVLQVPIVRRNEVVAVITAANKTHNYSDLDAEMLKNFVQLYYSLLEKKQVDEKLVETGVIFEQTQKVGRIGAWRFNFNQDEDWWSDVMYELYGFSKTKIPPPLEEVYTHVHPDDLPELMQAFEQAQKTGDLDIDFRIFRPDKEMLVVHATAQIIFDDKNKPKALIGLLQDITQRYNSLKKLEESSKKYEAIVESLPGVVYRFRYDDVKLLYMSDYFKKMFGVERRDNEFDDSSINYIKSIIHPDDFDSVEEVIVDAAENKRSFALKCRMFNAEGKSFWVSNTGKPIVNPEGELIIEGFIYDITDRVRSEERILNAAMEASDNEKTKISKEIHDSLQQTLTVASLNLEFVKKEKEKLSQRAGEKYETGWNYLKKALDETRGIAHSLMPKSIEDFGVIPLLNDMFNDLNKSSDTEFEFITNLSDQRFKNNIETNVYKIVQEATNNILKHAQASHVTVQYIKVGDMIQLSIEDDGTGFDTKKVDTAGGGFGLASMKSRATAISADFFVDSYIGRGTSMMIEFPFTPELIYYE